MLRIFFTRILAAAKNAIIGYNGYLLAENSDIITAENGDRLLAEGGDN